MSLWDIALEESKKKELDDDNLQNNSTIIIVGSEMTGKSTLLLRFLNKDEKPKPTTALEYAYGRQQRNNALAKDVCHIWELGGGVLLTNLLETPLTVKILNKLSVVVVIDLSKPERLLLTLENLLNLLRSRIDQLASKDVQLKDKLHQLARTRIGNDHMDKDVINPFPVPLIIFGAKYDIFQDMDPEHKKIICQTLRYVTHINGGMLQFFSSKMETLVTKMKTVMTALAFGSQITLSGANDYNKPLTILFGGDSVQSIDSVRAMDSSGKSGGWRHIFESKFPQVEMKNIMPDDPAIDTSFKEPNIDNLRAQKNDELERYRKELERRRKFRDDTKS